MASAVECSSAPMVVVVLQWSFGKSAGDRQDDLKPRTIEERESRRACLVNAIMAPGLVLPYVLDALADRRR